ncbi:MAG: aspartyl protease family protein [Planctomycetaceae bacterium]
MSFHFDPSAPSIVVPVTLVGPERTLEASLVLDTGAVQTLIAEALLAAVGCDVAGMPHTKSIITASEIVSVPEIRVEKIVALGRTRENHAVICHTLPETAGIDGLLRLGFFRNEKLQIDLVDGIVMLG